MMIQGKSCGYSVPSMANMNGGASLSGAVSEDVTGLNEAAASGFARILVPSLHLRSKPSISKDARTGNKAKRGEVYAVVKAGYDKAKDKESHLNGEALKEGEYQYLWVLLADPDDPTALKGWITGSDVMKIDGKPVLLQDADFHKTKNSASAAPEAALIGQVEAVQKLMEAKEKAMEGAGKSFDYSSDKEKTKTTPPSEGLSMGAKVAIALGAAAVAFLVVSKMGKK